MKLIKHLVEMTESADLAKEIVRGQKVKGSIWNKIDHWFMGLLFTQTKNTFIDAYRAADQLKKAGFNAEQIGMIRDTAVEAGFAALEYMKKKYPQEIVVPKYFETNNPSALQVAQLYLNVGDTLLGEFNALVQKLFDAKLKKIEGKLNIIKEASALNDVSIKDMEDKKEGRTADQLKIGDEVVITGNVEHEGSVGTIERFGTDKAFVVVNLFKGGMHSFHSSDVTESPSNDDEYADEDDEESENNKFWVVFYDEREERAWIGLVTKEGGGKWHEKAYKGKPEYRWGQSYMSYLSPDQVMQWIHKDYGRSMEIEGPYETAQEAEQFATHNYGSVKESVSEGKDPAYHLLPTVSNKVTKVKGRVDFKAKVEAEHGRTVNKKGEDGKSYCMKGGKIAAKYDPLEEIGHVYTSKTVTEDGEMKEYTVTIEYGPTPKDSFTTKIPAFSKKDAMSQAQEMAKKKGKEYAEIYVTLDGHSVKENMADITHPMHPLNPSSPMNPTNFMSPMNPISPMNPMNMVQPGGVDNAIGAAVGTSVGAAVGAIGVAIKELADKVKHLVNGKYISQKDKDNLFQARALKTQINQLEKKIPLIKTEDTRAKYKEDLEEARKGLEEILARHDNGVEEAAKIKLISTADKFTLMQRGDESYTLRADGKQLARFTHMEWHNFLEAAKGGTHGSFGQIRVSHTGDTTVLLNLDGTVVAKINAPEIDKLQNDTLAASKLHEQAYTDFEDWKKAVLASYPTYASKMKFKGRVEAGKDTVSAEVPGVDRSFGVWDSDKEKGVVLSESLPDAEGRFRRATGRITGWLNEPTIDHQKINDYIDDQASVIEVTPTEVRKQVADRMTDETLKLALKLKDFKPFATAEIKKRRNTLEEAAKDTIEAYGIKGMKREPWRRTFKDADAMLAWAEKYDAEIQGQRETDYAAQMNKDKPVKEGVGDTITVYQCKMGKKMGKYGKFNVERESASIITLYDTNEDRKIKFSKKTGRGIGDADQLMIEPLTEGERHQTPDGSWLDDHTGVRYSKKTGSDGNDSYMTPEYTRKQLEKRLKEIEDGPHAYPKEVARIKRQLEKLKGQHSYMMVNGKKVPMSEATAEERKVIRTRALIADYEKRAKESSNDIKKQHYLKMADQLRAELPVNEGAGDDEADKDLVAEIKAALKNGDDWTAKQYVKMIMNPVLKKEMQAFIKKSMYGELDEGVSPFKPGVKVKYKDKIAYIGEIKKEYGGKRTFVLDYFDSAEDEASGKRAKNVQVTSDEIRLAK